jgi:hypothetical protein
MATATKDLKRYEAAADQVRKLNERVIEASSNAGVAGLQVYGRLLKRLAESQEHAGKHGSEWLMAFGRAQATFTRDLSQALPAAAPGFGIAVPAKREAPTAKAKPKRAATKNGGLPIANYDKLTAKQIEGRLKRLSKPELRKLATYETKHKNRATVLKKIEALRAG